MFPTGSRRSEVVAYLYQPLSYGGAGMMKSVRLQLLVTLVAVAVAGGMLVSLGVPPGQSYVSSLHLGDYDGVRRSLRWGADPNEDFDQWPFPSRPLDIAVSRRYEAMVLLLIERGADVGVPNDYSSGLHTAATVTSADRRPPFPMSVTVHDARSAGSPGTPVKIDLGPSARLAEVLIVRGAPVDGRVRGGWTPLHVAANEGNIAVARVLLAHGAEVNAQDNWGGTPLRLAADKGHKEVADLLRRHGGRE